MQKTGDGIYTVLSLMALLLPLAPLLIIFIRRVYHHALLNLLRLVCLFAFLQQLVLFIPGLLPSDAAVAIAVSRLVEFILFFYLFKTAIAHKRVRDVLNILLVSFISILITIYGLRGPEAFPQSIALVQSSILIILSLVALVQLLQDRMLVLFREPLFWIAGGVLCQTGMFLFMEILLSRFPSLTENYLQEKNLVLQAAQIFRFGLFVVAGMVAKKK